MIRPEYFSSGYTHQGFSLFREKLWEAAEDLEENENLLRFVAHPTVYLISKASEYAEVYPRTIEDVALTAINLVGATLSQRCRRNLSSSVIWLGTDLTILIWQTMIFTVPLFKMIALFWNGYQGLKRVINPTNNEKSNNHLNFKMIQEKRSHPIITIREPVEKNDNGKLSNWLIPGYTQKNFAYVRASLYQAHSDIDTSNESITYLSKFTVKALATGTYLADLPIRLIEVVALSAINLVGCCFSKELRKNIQPTLLAFPSIIPTTIIGAMSYLSPSLMVIGTTIFAISEITKDGPSRKFMNKELLTARMIEFYQHYPELVKHAPIALEGKPDKHLKYLDKILKNNDINEQKKALNSWKQYATKVREDK